MLLSALLPSWKLALDAANKSPKTISSYLDSIKRLEAYLAAEGLPLESEGIRGFLAAERDRTSPASAQKHYRNLRVYFHWLLAEGEIKEDPIVRVEKPIVPEEAKPFFTDAELAPLLKATQGQGFEAAAITRSSGSSSTPAYGCPASPTCASTPPTRSRRTSSLSSAGRG